MAEPDHSIELAQTQALGGATGPSAEPVVPPASGTAAPAPRRRDRLERGEVVDRYVILGPLGAGGMGVVYAAYDPELDRRVALKLLKSSGRGDEARARLLREAQAMARLQHPNVVAVFDVGMIGERVWTAMELVEGRTLAALLAAGRPSWRETLDILEAVGVGLQAAHAAGLIHRDIKPENVMIGVDGRVRVVDFGLAREDGGTGARPIDAELRDLSIDTSSRLSGASKDLLRTEITNQSLVGTPAYMAPEQFLGSPVDVRTDVFAWCVTAWEALYGERPFAGDGLASLVIHVTSGKLRPPPAGAAVPTWIRRILERGLRPAPEARWPTMAALLAAIERGRRRARRRWAIVGVGAITAAIAGTLAGRAVIRERREAACDAAARSIDGVWHPEAAAAIEAVFAASTWRESLDAWARARARVDSYAAEWSAARRQICVDATLARTLTVTEATAREACMDSLRLNLGATLEILREADLNVVLRAVNMVSRQPSVSVCADPLELARYAGAERPGYLANFTHRVEIGLLSGRLNRASALQWAGKYPEALVAMEALLADVQGDTHRSERALVAVNVGLILRDLGRYDAAIKSLEQGAGAAVSVGFHEQARRATSNLCGVIGLDLGRPEDAQVWCDLGTAWNEFIGATESLGSAEHLLTRGELLLARGRQAEALATLEEALAIQRRILVGDDPTIAVTLNAYGVILEEMSRLDEAAAAYTEAIRITSSVLGAEHPERAPYEENLGNVLWSRGDLDGALAHHERALALRVGVSGDPSSIANSRVNIGNIHYSRGDYREAERRYQDALRTFEASVGEESPRIGYALVNLGAVHTLLGELDEAERDLERALTIRERALGREHSDVAFVLNNLADVYRLRGDLDRAASRYEEAAAIWEKVVGPDHPYLAYALIGQGTVARSRGDAAAARVHLERALKIREAEASPAGVAEVLVELGLSLLDLGEVDAAVRAETRAHELAAGPDIQPDLRAGASFGLARAIASAGESARAHDLARAARGLYVDQGLPRAREIAEIDAWLATHP